MPAISKIRFTNVVYEGGAKRYNDSVFRFDGHNGAVVLENGGGKTVFIQTAIQAVLPHTDLAGRKMRDTLSLENGPAHVAIEWLLAEKPRRRYVVTCVSLFMSATGLDSLRYVYEYPENDEHRLARIPFVKDLGGGQARVTEKGEIQEYYQSMQHRLPLVAKTFDTLSGFHEHLEQQLHIIKSEWEAIVKINSSEGGIEAFFDECKNSQQLVERLLIPTIENSMEGFKQGTFADLFQVRREGFKQYKELKERIEENRKILSELNRYVAGFEKLHLKEQEYRVLQREAKAHIRLAGAEETKVQEELELLERRLAEWEEQQTVWRKREASLHIAAERQKAGILETELTEAADEKERAADDTAAARRYYYSLQYAEHREKLREAEGTIASLKEQVLHLARSRDEEELQQAWEMSAQRLKGYYEEEEARLTVLLQKVQEECDELEREHKAASAEKEACAKEREQLLLGLREYETKQKMLTEQQSEIARRILSQLSSQTVDGQLPLWIGEQQELENRELELAKALQELERSKAELQQEERLAAQEQLVVRQELSVCEAWTSRYEEEQNRVKMALAMLQPSWERLASVHDRMDSIMEKLSDGIERRAQQKQQLLHKERLAFRYVDDYGEQELFFADPQAARLIRQWMNQFSLLEMGWQYVSATGGEGTAEASLGLLWSLTLVTTGHEKPLLLRKLAEVSDLLSFPIRVLSTQEVKALAEAGGRGEEEESARWVEPDHWASVQDPDRFREWKRETGQDAEQAEKRRKEKEAELEAWRDAGKLASLFFTKYPLEQVHEQERQATRLRERQQQLEAVLVRTAAELRRMDTRKDELHQEQHMMVQRQRQLEFQLEQATHYMVLSEQLAKLARDMQPVQEAFAKAERVLDRSGRRLELIGRELVQAGERRSDVKGRADRMREEELYQAVREVAPLPPEASFIQLREVYRELELARKQMMRERSELEQELRRQQERYDEAARQMKRLAVECPGLSEALELPLHVEARMDAALADLRQLEQKLVKLGEVWQRKNRELGDQEAVIRIRLGQYAQDFDGEEPLFFAEPLERVRERQAVEEKRQQELKKELERLGGSARRRQQELGRVLQLWDRHILVHKLDDPLLEEQELAAETAQQLLYRLEAASRASIGRLEQLAGVMAEERKRVTVSRQRFRQFCQQQVKDVKLREMAERGVDAKDSYGELQEFESVMATGILRANQIAELQMQTEDQKLQQFIAHIQTHLKQIAQELRELPKKTRVRTEAGAKEIYAILVPDWDEQEGKERIREHIEWIVGQLEQAKYQGEEGQEQASLVRKDLDKWLDAKQLLQKVLQQGGIRVSCRKVSNDQQITGASYSWEESNRWSGGEKWSKNMTLFLGILNYVAEKRQHIHSNLKRHRAVILDNPFGKASSDHVLSPVFYIAEQLGFQIIALTAHVEGKFLQDYFPVVYSCRLRAAAGGGGKQIIDPQQRIQQAYFRDHASEAIERIGGDWKQMELF